MATGIIVPGRRPVAQPQYAVHVNKGHWLAKDLTLSLNSAVPNFNAATDQPLTITGGGSGFSLRATPSGMALYTPNGGWADFNINQDWAGPNTIIAMCRLNSIDTPWGGLFSIGFGTNTQFAVGQYDTSGSLYGAVENSTVATFGGATISVLANGFSVLAFTHSGVASTAMTYYRNGLLVGSTTALGTQNSGAGVLGLGRSRDASASFDSDVDWIGFHRVKRVLSDVEIAEISRNFWAPFQSPARRIWVSVGGTTYNQGISGSLTPAGALTKQTAKALSGSSTATGALTKLTSKAFAGSIISTGVLSRSIAKSFAGSITSTGNIVKQTAKSFTGSVTGSGALSTMILFTASFAGSVTPSGTLSKMTQKALAGASTLTGAITKLTSKGLSASITLSGALNKLTTKAFAGSITVTGALAEAYQVLKSLAGSITPTGALAAAYIAFVAGVLKMLSLLGVGQ